MLSVSSAFLHAAGESEGTFNTLKPGQMTGRLKTEVENHLRATKYSKVTEEHYTVVI